MSHLFMRFPGGVSKTLTFSYDDGVEQDIRLIELFENYHLRATFNLNSSSYAEDGTVYPPGTIHRRLTKKQVSQVYQREGIEVAVHGATHPFLEQLPQHLATADLLQDRMALEEQFGTIVRGMAYPYGTYSDAVVESIKAVGLVYARTVEDTHDFLMPTDWLRLPATCHHNDPALMELAEKFLSEQNLRRPWMFYLWGHSYEFEANDNWFVIEDFVKKMAGREDIWYATNLEIYDYQEAFKQLQFSLDGHRVYNPTARPLWLEKDGVLHEIKSGECRLI